MRGVLEAKGSRVTLGTRQGWLRSARVWERASVDGAAARLRLNAWRAGRQHLSLYAYRLPDFAAQGSPLVTR